MNELSTLEKIEVFTGPLGPLTDFEDYCREKEKWLRTISTKEIDELISYIKHPLQLPNWKKMDQTSLDDCRREVASLLGWAAEYQTGQYIQTELIQLLKEPATREFAITGIGEMEDPLLITSISPYTKDTNHNVALGIIFAIGLFEELGADLAICRKLMMEIYEHWQSKTPPGFFSNHKKKKLHQRIIERSKYWLLENKLL
ncbi:MAG: hypothetical protein AAF518_23780 [Spirochaetota bacterium]